MKKSWKKPTMYQIAAGFEISRYLPAETAPRK
ncbi:pyrroloquinoline quinone precursor peptide PqqA [Mesorhizobium sp. SARCC-RB16n]|nr:pyrroloquinoline quinone precursor peptide PqqA [Mesorhizobium sp. SARCC-RB16n]TPI26604.1 pyrroloquinoline quinone precursor peptide PqqA [Mesorhizobium sp. B3-2-1]